jgi:phosphoribosylformylglycinamidine synthase subunit PurQ / glutaminase
MKKPRVCILRTAGTNCDKETAYAFERAGSLPVFVHINRLLERERALSEFQILVIPGGFSYGDDIAAGKILANELKGRLADGVRTLVSKGRLVIGICNGFQVLVKSGFLPGNASLRQEVSLILNDSAKFEARWTYLKKEKGRCVWTRELAAVIYLPVAHGEGKFVARDQAVQDRLVHNGQVVFRYCDERGNQTDAYPFNPNGSSGNIAGICDETGQILGLMPHPERHVRSHQHPRWSAQGVDGSGDGLDIFKSGVDYVKKNL